MLSRLYAGNQHSAPVYIPSLVELDTFLGWSAPQKARTIVRSDAGFGSDDNINYALGRQWQVLTKSSGGRRPAALARQVTGQAWQAVGSDRWLASVPFPPLYVCPTRTLLLKWLDQKGKVKLAAVVCSVTDWSSTQVVAHYDHRGQCETEIQADKGGLRLCRRRKHNLAAQEALVLLTDIAHNLIAWSANWMMLDKPLNTFGTTRFIEDVLTLPGQIHFNGGRLYKIELNELHPHAQATADGLRHLLDHFGNP